jgi:hypothetical protein
MALSRAIAGASSASVRCSTGRRRRSPARGSHAPFFWGAGFTAASNGDLPGRARPGRKRKGAP